MRQECVSSRLEQRSFDKYDGSLDANCKQVDGQPRQGLINKLQKNSAADGPSWDVES